MISLLASDLLDLVTDLLSALLDALASILHRVRQLHVMRLRGLLEGVVVVRLAPVLVLLQT